METANAVELFLVVTKRTLASNRVTEMNTCEEALCVEPGITQWPGCLE
jgi:hypothetical protein